MTHCTAYIALDLTLSATARSFPKNEYTIQINYNLYYHNCWCPLLSRKFAGHQIWTSSWWSRWWCCNRGGNNLHYSLMRWSQIEVFFTFCRGTIIYQRMVGLWLLVGESRLILKRWWLNSEDCGMRDKGGRRSCTSSSAFPVQVEHLTIVWKHLTIFAWVYLIQEIRDSLIIITASPGFIVRAGREPKNMIEIDQIRRNTRGFPPC